MRQYQAKCKHQKPLLSHKERGGFFASGDCWRAELVFFSQLQQAYLGAGAEAHGDIAPHPCSRGNVERHGSGAVQAGAEAAVHARHQRKEEEELAAVRVAGKLEIHAEGGILFGFSWTMGHEDDEVGRCRSASRADGAAGGLVPRARTKGIRLACSWVLLFFRIDTAQGAARIGRAHARPQTAEQHGAGISDASHPHEAAVYTEIKMFVEQEGQAPAPPGLHPRAEAGVVVVVARGGQYAVSRTQAEERA